MTTEWIEHHGKGYPDLLMDTLVRVRFAKGDDGEYPWAVKDWDVNWVWDVPGPGPNDITHYRVVAK